MDLSFLEPEVRDLIRPLAGGKRPGAVCFDADGTLWPSDVGEEFLEWLDRDRRLPARPQGGAWAEYQARLQADALGAYTFAVEVMAGLTLEQVHQWATPFVKERFIPRLYPPIRSLIDVLRSWDQEIWIVSGSNAWVVRAAASMLGIPPQRVIAFGSEIAGGRLTKQLTRPWPVGAGKAEALRGLGVKAILAAGNSVLDREMLQLSERAFLVVDRKAPDPAAMAMARGQGWPVQWV